MTEDPAVAFVEVWEATADFDDFFSWELDLVGDLGNLVGGGVSLNFCSEKSYTDRSTVVCCWGFWKIKEIKEFNSLNRIVFKPLGDESMMPCHIFQLYSGKYERQNSYNVSFL